MKRGGLIILIVLLLAAAVSAGAAQDAVYFDQTQRDGDVTTSPEAISVEAVDGILYILESGFEHTLYRLAPGEAQPQPVMETGGLLNDPFTPTLAGDGERLYMISVPDDTVWRWEEEGFTPFLTPDFSALRQAGIMTLKMPVVTGDMLYALSESGKQWVSLSLSDGAVRVLDVPALSSLCAYRDGELLATLAMSVQSDPRVCVLDEEGNVLRTLCDLPLSRVCAAVYDPAGDAVYVYSEGQVMLVGEDGALTTVNYLPDVYAPSVDDVAFLAPDGFVLLSKWTCLSVRSTAPEDACKTPLRISGTNGGKEAEAAFTRAYPDIPVVSTWTPYTAEEIAQAVRSGEDAVDIFRLGGMHDVSALIDQGFAEPLDTPALREATALMYESAQAYLAREGVPYAVPYAVRLDLMRANEALLSQFGFDGPPRTVLEYVEMVTRWRELYGGEHEDYVLDYAINLSAIDEADYATLALQMALHQYVSAAEARGESVRFDTPAFISLLEAIAGLPEPQELQGCGDDLLYQQNALLDTRYDLALHSQEEIQRPGAIFPWPAAFEGAPQAVTAEMDVYILNPNSKNKEAAIRFLALTATQPPVLAGYILRPGQNDPLEFVTWQEGYEERKQDRDALRAQIYTADPADRAGLEAVLAKMEAWEVNWERTDRWRFGPDDVAALRPLTAHLDFGAKSLRRSLLKDGFGELEDICKRFLSGGLSARQAAQEMERKAAMWRMEL